jgi:hypothetical protein
MQGTTVAVAATQKLLLEAGSSCHDAGQEHNTTLAAMSITTANGPECN